MKAMFFLLASISLLYTPPVLAQNRTTTALITQVAPGQWLVQNQDGSSHLVIYDRRSGFYSDTMMNSGSQDNSPDMSDPCVIDPQTGLYVCQ